MTKTKTAPLTWLHEFRVMTTRNWRAKLLAVVVAFFFWNMIKQQTRPQAMREREQLLEEHSLGSATGFTPPRGVR